MKRFAMLLTAVAVFSGLSLAQDGAATYKAKCAMCHGANGEGKSGPAIAGAPAAKVTDVLTKGGATKAPHTKPMAGLTADQASALATYVASLKK